MLTKNKNLSRLFFGAFVALAAVGCGQQEQVAPPVGEYATMSIEKSDCSLSKIASATIRGRQDISILPQVSGTLTELRVKEGDRVKRGDVMFVIDQVPYIAAVKTAEAAVATATASLATAELTYESKVKLYEANVVSEFDLTTALNSKLVAEAQLAECEAQLVNAQNNLSYTTVKSPADGVIGTLPYRVGALVSSAIAEPLTTVSDNSVMEVYFSITEGELLSMIRESGSREKALELIHDQMDKLCTTLLTPRQLSIAKRQFVAQLAISMESNEGYMLGAGKSFLVHGDVDTTEEIYRKVAALNAESIMEVADEIFKQRSMLIYK